MTPDPLKPYPRSARYFQLCQEILFADQDNQFITSIHDAILDHPAHYPTAKQAYWVEKIYREKVGDPGRLPDHPDPDKPANDEPANDQPNRARVPKLVPRKVPRFCKFDPPSP
jgi:hypothetical protein